MKTFTAIQSSDIGNDARPGSRFRSGNLVKMFAGSVI